MRKFRKEIKEVRADIQEAIRLVNADRAMTITREQHLLTCMAYLAHWLSDETGVSVDHLYERAQMYAKGTD